MTLRYSTRARLITALVLLMVLGAGVALGMALERRAMAQEVVDDEAREGGRRSGGDDRFRGSDPSSEATPSDSTASGDSIRRRPRLIVDQVGLSEDQKSEVDSIVGHFRAQMKALHDEFDEVYSARYREITQATREEIRAILTPDQQRAYDSLLVEWDNRRRDRREDPGRGRDGG